MSFAAPACQTGASWAGEIRHVPILVPSFSWVTEYATMHYRRPFGVCRIYLDFSIVLLVHSPFDHRIGIQQKFAKLVYR